MLYEGLGGNGRLSKSGGVNNAISLASRFITKFLNIKATGRVTWSSVYCERNATLLTTRLF